ncbi:centromere protein W [Sphaerodactylus townsendi]|uniref:centromere protein W n=1 Tax=Sphaerodactylus townsendi TaxID=933632 RepID=UPI002026B7C1|nr:centromere protein W [Sphaerodactylus townsendi]
MKRTVSRNKLKGLVRRHKPQLGMAANMDLLVHLNFLLFLHRLAEETRTKAIADKSKTIKYEHVLTSAKVILRN